MNCRRRSFLKEFALETLTATEVEDEFDYAALVVELEGDIEETRAIRDRTRNRLEILDNDDEDAGFTHSIRVNCTRILRLCDECLVYYDLELARYRSYV